MAFFNMLDPDQQANISSLILSKASAEHEQAYQDNVRKATSKTKIKKCAGCYIGQWQRLHQMWIDLKVPNLFVYHCLQVDSVENDPFGVEFTEC
ncbi:hypothetical protein HNW13_018650 [Shewanella sp. BF02_Schw]|uniref:hypothetical protein n=1 Tax=Shewanella sp. BF02_Schw TaxID=394908 RepID=UPI00177BEBDF|nr:hypothetical protein [Shewanella sp. BF02_Schw]MBO1897762.1 hypothetical protein [Shewanella sp. BF02_Schw]